MESGLNMPEKLSNKDKQALKAKIKLWCVLNGVKIGIRENDSFAIVPYFVYHEACVKCKHANHDKCPALADKVLIMNMKCMRMSLLSAVDERGRRKLITKKNKYIWCVEWVKHV